MRPRAPRLPVRVRLAAVTALLVLGVGATLLATSYWLLVDRLPDSVVVRTSGGAQAVPVGTEVTPQAGPAATGGAVLAAPEPSGGDGSVPVESVDALVLNAARDAATQYRGELMRTFATQSAVLLGALTVAAVAVGGLAARRALHPVRGMAEAARRLGVGSLGERLPVAGPPDELTHLAVTFNAMLDRLEAAFGRERRLMANVSHELRTPLANQRAALEVALDDPEASAAELRRLAGQALEQNRRAHHLIEELLVLARAEQDTDDGEVTDLAGTVRHAVTAAAALTDAVPGLDVRLDLSPVPVRGQPLLLERLVGNLVENALRHNVDGGFVRVSTAAGDGVGRVTVENSGPVVRPDAVTGLFEPFRRGAAGSADRVRSDRGAGLGLAIVSAVARRHRAEVEAVPRPDGGLLVTVTLPAAGAGGTAAAPGDRRAVAY